MMLRINGYHAAFLLISSICHSFTIVDKRFSFLLRPSSSCHRRRNRNHDGVGNTRHVLWNHEQLEDTTVIATTTTPEKGLYRNFVDYAWNELIISQENRLSLVDVPKELSYMETTTPGPRDNNSTVRITIQAANSTGSSNSMGTIQYARYALIETISATPESKESRIHTNGIQVMNMVIIPYKHTGLPVFGADFVTLPGNKHLLLLDAQPVRGIVSSNDTTDDQLLYDEWFQQWYRRNHIQQQYEWGGDLPPPVQQYVSKYALWTRLGSGANTTTINTTQLEQTPIEIIQNPIMDGFIDHFHTYLQLLKHYDSSTTSNEQHLHDTNNNNSRLPDYLKYRLENDPARPMLKRLFGEEWTEMVLHDILFPIHLF